MGAAWKGQQESGRGGQMDETLAKPFEWTFTRQDLLKVLARVTANEAAEPSAGLIQRYVTVIT